MYISPWVSRNLCCHTLNKRLSHWVSFSCDDSLFFFATLFVTSLSFVCIKETIVLCMLIGEEEDTYDIN